MSNWEQWFRQFCANGGFPGECGDTMSGRQRRHRPRALFAVAGPVLALAAVLLALPVPAGPAAAADSAVVVMYHRFGDGRYPSTNIRLEQFEAHLAEIADGPYTVLPLPEIVSALRSGRPLPDRTIGLSIDDAYLSVYTEAWPRLREAGLPFTLFVATDPIDRGFADHMSWDQLRELAAAGVTIGSQTASHLHMAASGEAANRRDVETSNRRFEAELGRRPDIIAYPYGEASLAVEALARETGFVAGFGQHSGVIHAGGNLYYMPRFAMNEAFGDIKRFRLAANALPIPVTDVTPADHLVATNNPPAMGFTVVGDVPGLGRLSCYASHVDGALSVERLGESRIEVRMAEPFPKGRGRVNCTLPAGDGRWRWLGRQFYVAE